MEEKLSRWDRAKKILKLFFVMLAVPLISLLPERRRELWFAKYLGRKDQKIPADLHNEVTLRNYLDKMADLLLKENLLEKKDNKDDPTVNDAQVRTVTTIRELDEKHRNFLFQFLRDEQLTDFILAGASLNQAKLSKANLRAANLGLSDLSEADLCEADLRKANLSGADLSGADLSEANLSEADLSEADLSRANLGGKSLNRADFFEIETLYAILISHQANLSGGDLSGANLEWAAVDKEQLDKAKSLKDATMPNGTIYDGRFDKKEDSPEDD